MNTLQQMGIQQWRLRKGRLRTPEAEIAAAPDSEVCETGKTGVKDVSSGIESAQVIHGTVASQGVIKPASGQSLNHIVQHGSWQDLRQLLLGDALCNSCKQTTPLLGEGDLQAEWMFVIDAPTTADISNQRLLSGRAGQLFDAMLAAAGLSRETIYLTSVFKCPPSKAVSAQCGTLVHRQLSLIKPRVLMLMGEFASQSILRTNDKLDILRTKEQSCLGGQTAAITSYSPAQLLENPVLKAQVWQDLKKCLRLSLAP